MGKCVRCGRKGWFLKTNDNHHCLGCESIVIAEKRVKQLEQVENELEARKDELAAWNRDAKIEYDHLRKQNEDLTQQLEKNKARNLKLKTMGNSIKALLDAVSNENYDAEKLAAQYADIGIESLFSEPELNCLTMKDLRSRYNAIRKQIAEVCQVYEERYTTKANAAIYKLMVLALEAEIENVLYKMQFGKLDTAIGAVRDLTSKYYTIATDGNKQISPTIKRFIAQIESLYIEIVQTEYEYYVQRERAKEEQRALREQMRQEAEERKRLEAEKKKVEAEEKKYQQEMQRIVEQMQSAHDAEHEKLRKRLAELEALQTDVEKKKADIINLQNGKAGTVYVISNIGSFGENVFKVGMTRRIDPQDRVNELGDASVPFPFDVHSFIFSQDAVALETALHHELNDRRVNKVNLRKEFFHVTIEELEKMVERIDPTAPFKVTALAEQYRQSLSIDKVPENTGSYYDDEAV